MIDKLLLEKLICPITREALVYDALNETLINKSASYMYKIKDGIPLLMREMATKLTDDTGGEQNK